MGFRLFAAVSLLATAISPAIAQKPRDRPMPSRADAMNCQELIQIREDRSRWDRLARNTAVTDNGWSLRSKQLGLLDAREKLVESVPNGRIFETQAGANYIIGGAIFVENNSSNSGDVGRLTYYHRWITDKPAKFDGAPNRCSSETLRQVRAGSVDAFGLKLETPEELDNQYAFIAYDGRKNILFTATLTVRPKQESDPGLSGQPTTRVAPPESRTSDAGENAAALRVAYQSLMLLERCFEMYANGVPLATSRDRVARIEKSAAAIGIDVRAAKAKAQQDSKANLEMFEMVEALGSLNYRQRDSLKQFCALQGMTLLEASKHFAELDRAAGR